MNEGIYNCMEKQDFWKRTQDTEIDLADLMKRICRQWKQILLCAAAAALILGVYGWMKDSADPDTLPGTAKETELTEEEEQKIEYAVSLKNEITGLEKYLEDSILMHLDPYHKNRVIMLYCIDQAGKRELEKITESYLNFAANGGAANKLNQSFGWQTDKTYLAELISVYQKTNSSPNQAVFDYQKEDSLLLKSLFYIEVIGRDAEEAKKLALDIQKVLEEYSVKEQLAGSHRLTLLNSVENVTADSGLQSLQHEKWAQLSSIRASLKAMTDTFREAQMAVYQQAAGLEHEMENAKEGSSVYKYIFWGILGGAFGYCSIFLCWYLFSDSVKSIQEMKDQYTIPVYGKISQAEKRVRKRSGGKNHTSEQEIMLVTSRIRLECKKQGMIRLYAASAFSLNEREKRILDDIAEKLRREGISMTSADNIMSDTVKWEELVQAGCVLMICRLGTTTHRMIDDAMHFCNTNSIAVTGTVVFSANK